MRGGLAMRARLQRFVAKLEATIAIAAFDEILVTHFHIDLGMAERAAAAIASDTRLFDENGIRGWGGRCAHDVSDGSGRADHSRHRRCCNRKGVPQPLPFGRDWGVVSG